MEDKNMEGLTEERAAWRQNREMQPQAKEGWQPPEAEKGKEGPPGEVQSGQQCSFGLLALEPWEYSLLVKLPSLWYSIQLPQQTDTDKSDTGVTSLWN